MSPSFTCNVSEMVLLTNNIPFLQISTCIFTTIFLNAKAYNYALKCFSMLFLGHETTVIYHTFQFSQFSHSVVSDSLQPRGLQYPRLSCPLPTPGACSNYGHQVGDAIQPSHLLSCLSPPAFNLFQHQGLFQ